MAYSAEVIRRARQRLAQARSDREAENRNHQENAYRQVPRLREIDRQLRLTMAMAARAVYASGSDVQAAMEEVKNKNLALQQERSWLIDSNFEEGYLDESPVCSVCGGTGYIGSTMCECLKELCRQEQKKELTVLGAGRESFDQFRLDYYSDRFDSALGASPRTIMEKTFQTCRSFAAGFSEKSGSLLFSGDTGLGKTFLSACIARAVADGGHSVIYESAGHLFANLEKARFSGDPEACRESAGYTACDLLIVDDLGTELAGQFVVSALYTLINDRLLENMPTIISTNLNTEDLQRRYSAQIASRLRGSYRRVAFVGDDIRLIRNRGL